MPVPVTAARRIAFGAYEADLHSGELTKDGKRVRLQAQPFQLLVMLLDRPGQLVTREEICQKLWSADTFVDFDHSLGTAINKIREVLNDSVAEPRFVETIPRRGYRFIAPVTAVAADPPPVPQGQGAPSPPPAELAQVPLWKRHFVSVIGAGVATALLVSALIAWNFHGWRQWLSFRLSASTPVQSIAVLPLLNLSSDPDQQFFADGVTDELITNLAQIGSLRVISHTSAMAYSGTHKSAPEIAHELGVDALVEGSVVRSGNKVRITAQLIQAASDRHLWARTYDRELSDVLTVQGEVAREIADSVSLRLTPQERARLSRPHPMNPEIALLYFKGSYFLSKLDAPRAEQVFTEAIHLDPNSAESWAGLADALHTIAAVGKQYDAFPRARDAANKALEIDPSEPRALMVLGVVAFLYDWKPNESEAFFRRSLEARPGDAVAHALFATILAHRGKVEESIQQIKLASASDPVSLLTNSQAWHVYFSARRYDEALRAIHDTVEVDPTFAPAQWRLAVSWEQRGEYQKAIDTGATGVSDLGPALAAGGPRGYWQGKLESLLQERRPGDRYGFSAIARCYMHLGKREEALKTLEKAYQMHDPYLIFWLPVYEEFDPLRLDPRFQRMLHGIGVS
jgi:TolB-like protein/DNA-binding winged helix-turn-helix (wHTH) protein/tetratricopeptide (TPR) repeat protein